MSRSRSAFAPLAVLFLAAANGFAQTPATPAPRVVLEGRAAGEERDDNGLKLKLCWCPPGTFRMGSPPDESGRGTNEGPVQVTLSRGFWMARYEVTQAQWQQVMKAGIREQQAKAKGPWLRGEGPEFPIYYVNYDEAMEFCRLLTETERREGRLPASWEYRLPTEAQWEFACRAGTTTATAFGDRLSSQDANCDGNHPYNGAAKGPFLDRAAPVGSYRPNGWGLYDMHGNVWEWCADGFDATLPGGVDPAGPSSTPDRVIRGGSWLHRPTLARSAFRRFRAQEDRNDRLGLRVARVPSPPEARAALLTPARSLGDLGAHVMAVAFSPDGKRLIWGGDTNKLVLCDPSDGPPQFIDAGAGSTLSVTFSPDGQTIARGGGDGFVRLWDAASMRSLATFTWQDEKVYSVAYAPDGRILAAGGQDGSVKLWDLGRKRELPAPPRQALAVARIGFSPDGRTLVMATGDWKEYKKPGEVTFWDVATAAPRGAVRGFRSRVAALAVAPGGRTIAAGDGDGTRLCDLATATVVRSHVHEARQVNCLAFSPDGRFLVSGHNTGEVVLWEVATGRKRAILKGHQGVALCVAFAPDGRMIVTGGLDGTLKFWDLRGVV